jgi:hypothetical protein
VSRCVRRMGSFRRILRRAFGVLPCRYESVTYHVALVRRELNTLGCRLRPSRSMRRCSTDMWQGHLLFHEEYTRNLHEPS